MRALALTLLALAAVGAQAQTGSLTATDGLREDRVSLSWTVQAPAGSFLRVKRGAETLTALAAGATSYDDLTAALDVRYTYRVVVVTGGVEGASVQDEGWREARQVAGVTATRGASATTVRVAWQDQSAIETGHRVFRDGALIETLGANARAYTDTPPAQGVAYEYCVAAVFGDVEGTRACATGSTSGGAAVASVTASDGAFPDRVEVAWTDAGAAPDGYLVRRDDGVAAVADGAARSAADFAATPGATHTYGVQRMTGTAGQALLFYVGRGGYAADYDSGRNYATCSATVEGWVRRSNVEIGANVFATLGTGAGAYRLRIEGGAVTLRVTAGDGQDYTVPGGTVAPDAWTHLAFSRACPGDGTIVLTTYLNGTERGRRVVPGVPNDQLPGYPHQWRMGDDLGGGEYFETALDDVRHWNVARSGVQIRETMFATIPEDSAADLVASFDMEGTFTDGNYDPRHRIYRLDYYMVYGVPAVPRPRPNALSPAVTDAGSVSTPATPTAVAASDAPTAATDDGVRVSWTGAAGATGYRVSRAAGADVPFDAAAFGVLATLPAGASPDGGTLDATAALGATYTYCVQTIKGEAASAAACDTGSRRTVVPPTAVAATDGTSETATTITWQTASTATAFFEVYRGDALVETLPASARQFADAGGVANAPYAYCVVAVTGAEARTAADAACDAGRRDLKAPTAMTASDETNERHVEVKWTDNSAAEDGYVVLRRPVGETGAFAEAGRVGRNEGTFLDRTGDPGVTYTYSVAATQTTGGVEGRSATATDAGRRVLLAPAALAASDGTDEATIALTWTDRSQGETGYRVAIHGLENYQNGGPEFVLATLPANATGYVHDLAATGFLAGTYVYRVYAVQDRPGGGEPWRSASVVDEGSSRLLAPADLRAEVGADAITLAWVDRSAMEAGYRVTRDESPLATLGSGAQGYRDAGASGAHTYCVQATGVGGAASDEVCVRTESRTPFNPGPALVTIASATPTANEGLGTVVAADGDVIATISRPHGDYNVSWLTVFQFVDDQWRSVYRLSSQEALAAGGFPSSFDDGGLSVHGGTVAALRADKRVIVVRKEGAGPAARWVGTNAFSAIETNFTTTPYTGHRIEVLPNGTEIVVLSHFTSTNATTGVPVSTNSRAALWTMSGSSWVFRNGTLGNTLSGANTYVSAASVVEPGQSNTFSVVASRGLDSDGKSLPGEHPLADFRVYTHNGSRTIGWSNDRYEGGGASFGWDVAAEGEYLAVSAPNIPNVEGTAAPAINVYRFNGAWSYLYAITDPSNALKWLGEQIEIEDGTLIATGYDRTDNTLVVQTYDVATGELRGRVRPGTPAPAAASLRPGGRGTMDVARSAVLLGARTLSQNGVANAGGILISTLTPPPANVAATDGDNPTEVVVRWQDASAASAPNNEIGFRVYRDGAVVGETGPDATSYTDAMAQPGDAHRYCVSAISQDFATSESSKACDFGWRPADGAISGRVAAGEGGGVPDVYVHLGPGPNGAVLLDGQGGHFEAVDGAALQSMTGAVTVEAWVRLATVQPQQAIATAGLGYALHVSGGQVKAHTTSTTSGSVLDLAQGGTVRAGEWTHLAMRFDGAAGQLSVFVNGQRVDQRATAGSSLQFGGFPFLVGRLSYAEDNDTQPLQGGLVDEVRVWSVARTDDQIAASYGRRLSGTEGGLVGYWPLDETGGEGRASAAGTPGRNYLVRRGGAHATRFGSPLPGYARTDADGRFRFTALRYGSGRTFRLTPTASAAPPVNGDPGDEGQAQGLAALAVDAEATAQGDALVADLFADPVGAVALALDESDLAGDDLAAETFVLDELAVADAPLALALAAVRSFNPGSQDVRLTREAPIVNDVRFTDASAFAVAGTVTHTATGCAVPDAAVLLDGQHAATTDAEGRYVLTAQPGLHTVTVTRAGQAFRIAGDAGGDTYTLDVQGSRSSIDFVGVTTRALALRARGTGDRTVFDTATLLVRSADGCFSREVVAPNGAADLAVSPGTYLVSVKTVGTTVAGVDREHVLAQYEGLGAVTVDLTEADATAELTYHAPVRVAVEGLPESDCQPVPVLAQARTYPVTIRAFEDFGASGHEPVEADSLVVYDEISGRTVTLAMTDGEAAYEVVAGFPNVIRGTVVAGVARDHQKRLRAVVHVGAGRGEGEAWAIVTGSRPRQGTEFVTAPQPTPIMVLRDPPGDGSSASITRGSRFCNTSELFFQIETGIEVELFAQIGFEGAGGIAVADVESSVSIGAANALVRGVAIDNAYAWCVTTEETISTSDDSNYVGADGDLFIGLGVNYLFAVTDRLQLDGCELVLDQGIGFAPAGVDGAYTYTRHHIEEVLLPELLEIAEGGSERAADAGDAMATWDSILKANPSGSAASSASATCGTGPCECPPGRICTGQDVRPAEVRSFSAGASYDYAYEVSETDGTYGSYEISLQTRVGGEFEALVGGSGLKGSAFVSASATQGGRFGTEDEASTRFAYTLTDDDPGDAYLTSVSTAPGYRSPVFEVLAGYSSCPYEPWEDTIIETGAAAMLASLDAPQGATAVPASGTFYGPFAGPDAEREARRTTAFQAALIAASDSTRPRAVPRDWPLLSVDRPEVRGADPDVPAVVTLFVQNDSQSGEERTYWLRSMPETNPNGAQLRANGVSLSSGVRFVVAPGQTQQVVLEIGRGPQAYLYEDLALELIPMCAVDDLAEGPIGGPRAEVSVTVEFATSAGPVAFRGGLPMDGWRANRADADVEVELVGFQPPSSSGAVVRAVGAQARRLGDGADWAEAFSISDPSGPSVSHTWAVPSGTPDGPYALRPFVRLEQTDGSVTTAFGAELAGRIDRSRPLVHGLPRPSTGVLAPGQPIAVTFTEALDPASVTTGAASRTVALRDLDAAGAPIVDVTATLSADGTELVVLPFDPDALVHGRRYQATVDGVTDLAGNPLLGRPAEGQGSAIDDVSWSFVAVRAERGLVWSPGAAAVTVEAGEAASAEVLLVNAEPVQLAVAVAGDPAASWLTVAQAPGSLRAGEAGAVRFAVAPSLGAGTHTARVAASAGAFRDTLDVTVYVVPAGSGPPRWAVDPGAFEGSMTAVARVKRSDGTVLGPGAVVGAFVGAEVRGVARVQEAEGYGSLAFLSVHTNVASGEAVTFRVYDPETALVTEGYTLYDGATAVVSVTRDAMVGTTTAPAELRIADGELAIPLAAGWSWVSTNRVGPTGLNEVFAGVGTSPSDIIKTQTATSAPFALFSAQGGWSGSLATFERGRGYLVRLAEPAVLAVRGGPGAADDAIAVGAGWNWIGFHPAGSLDINQAFGAGPFQDGDVIKGQRDYSEYVDGVWLGRLTRLEPGRGYQLWLSAPGEVRYSTGPPSVGGSTGPVVAAAVEHERSMTVTAAPELPDGFDPEAYRLQALDADGGVRGEADLAAVTAGGPPLAFLLVHGDAEPGEVTLRLVPRDPASGLDVLPVGPLAYEPDAAVGSVRQPHRLSAHPTAGGAATPVGLALETARPNPVAGRSRIVFSLPAATSVRLTVSDVLGREVAVLAEGPMPAGAHGADLDATRLAPGTYLCRLVVGTDVLVRPLTVVR